MKIRSGFVSNSSSSSFVIRTNRYEDIYGLAIHMVETREWKGPTVDWTNDRYRPNDDLQIEIIKRGSSQDKCFGERIGISFDTCNYRTYIYRHRNLYLVSTCHNHPFTETLFGVTNQFDENTKEILKALFQDQPYENCDSAILENMACELPQMQVFWLADFALYGSAKSEEWPWRYCKKHHQEHMEIIGRGYCCPACVIEGKEIFSG